MPIRSDPLDELLVPDGTTVEEHDLVTDGDVIVGGQSTVEFGVRGESLIAGERTRFGGDIEAEGDCRLDMWSDVTGNVLVGEDAYLGERVHVGGQLKVAGDLDIGDDVDIEDGFEANGWIVIRNPMPTIVFLFVYLSQLLRIGEEEAAERMLSELLVDEDREADPLVIPRGARVGDDAWRVSTPATIGDDCRIHGNLRAEKLEVGRDNTIFGSLRAKRGVVVGRETDIKGDVTTREGDVRVGPGVHVWGDIVADDVALHENATVEGTIRANGEMRMHTDEVLDSDDEAAEAMAEMAAQLDEDREETPGGRERANDAAVDPGAAEASGVDATDDPDDAESDDADSNADGPPDSWAAEDASGAGADEDTEASTGTPDASD